MSDLFKSRARRHHAGRMESSKILHNLLLPALMQLALMIQHRFCQFERTYLNTKSIELDKDHRERWHIPPAVLVQQLLVCQVDKELTMSRFIDLLYCSGWPLTIGTELGRGSHLPYGICFNQGRYRLR